ncbi:MAG TPA: hypothetical protein VGD22_20015 [Sphingobacteriaceae bacterium]
MKTFLVIVSSLCILTKINAQPGNSDTKTDLLNLLKSKHNYERMLSIGKDTGQSYKARYCKAFTAIKVNQEKVLSYINYSLKFDSTALSKEFVDYVYVNPVSSVHNIKNRISLLGYFKIIKYSLENSEEILPRSTEILFK